MTPEPPPTKAHPTEIITEQEHRIKQHPLHVVTRDENQLKGGVPVYPDQPVSTLLELYQSRTVRKNRVPTALQRPSTLTRIWREITQSPGNARENADGWSGEAAQIKLYVIQADYSVNMW